MSLVRIRRWLALPVLTSTDVLDECIDDVVAKGKEFDLVVKCGRWIEVTILSPS
jgi:hypothetical protein